MKKLKPLHKDIINLINLGQNNTQISKQLSVTMPVIFYVKRRYKDRLETLKPIVLDTNISNYENIVVTNLKNIVIKLTNTLTGKSIQKESSTQLLKSIGIAIDKLRLIEGKSTQNILVQTFHDLPDDIKSMLRETVTAYKDNKLGKGPDPRPV